MLRFDTQSWRSPRNSPLELEREAQVLASLNYPNIAATYGVEERALVLELVEGPTLAERIAQGPMPLEEALSVARQIAGALEYAHERGVVHRDLKPANIKVSRDGIVKVLDFGLAKALNTEPASGVTANSPTLTIQASIAGIILGTAAYMSPEQAKGKAVDRRADIWAFGAVFYEMLTARPLYTGENVSETLAAVIMKEPDLSGLPANTPSMVKNLLVRALDRDPQQRLQAIGEARIALERAMLAEADDTPSESARSSRAVLPWAAAACFLLIAAAALGVLLWRATRPVDRPLLSLSVDLGPEAISGPQTTAAISPDGTRLVYPVRSADGRQSLAVRLLNQAIGASLPGTEGGINPFFSPDGQWIGFFALGKLKKISVTGGAAVALCDAATGRGGSWGEDGYIIATLGNTTGLARIPEGGGTPQLLTKPADTGDLTHRWPQIVPGGSGVLFTANGEAGAYDDARIDAFDFKTGRQKTVLRGGYFARCLPTGHLVYIHQGTLFGVAFDPVRLEVKGTPAPLVEGIAAVVSLGGGQFHFSQNGTFVYLSGPPESGRMWPVLWMNQSGATEPLIAAPGAYINPRISPDGKRLALSVGFGAADIWIYGFHGEAPVRLTFGNSNHGPVWSPDGKHIVYFTQSNGKYAIMWTRSDGAGEPQRLLESKSSFLATHSFSPNGRRLAFTEVAAETRSDIWALPLDATDPEHPKPGTPEPLLRTPAIEQEPAFSLDGHWLAYASNESGNSEVYVMPVSGGGKWQVSTGGGNNPVWSRAARQLFLLRSAAAYPGRRLHGKWKFVPARQCAAVGGQTYSELEHWRRQP